MSYKSIFVNIDIDCAAVGPIVGYAAALARDFDAHLTGLCGTDIPLPVVAADGMVFDGEAMVVERKEIEARHKELEAEFDKALSGVAVKSQMGVLGLRSDAISGRRSANSRPDLVCPLKSGPPRSRLLSRCEVHPVFGPAGAGIFRG
ncbi:hypothetical protein [Pseudaminobacter soli (ex Li et al. 2025)]|uniref:Universal stress protein n=1 Tax=Pseudaminobacter soli (ex Li et al. 2025) TaxID=1295366 RepID=A0A2P7S2B5_9HYPH|nr:hypothetical protein [Mesorhizobium soli]PSJ56604.1 hypothetical protein C7I85_23855 [Mesorhizobium soli]